MFNNFFKLDKPEIVALVQKYLEEHLFADNSGMKAEVIVAISGSVASSHYDRHSDIDLDFYCKDEKSVNEYKAAVSRFKSDISSQESVPIQVHRLKSLVTVKDDIASYKNDNTIREIAQSLVVIDPNGSFVELQHRFEWYPKDVATEKLQWLYAQLIFEHEEHFKIAAERNNTYYIQVSKLNIIRLAGNTMLLTNKKWPAFDKHLFASLKDAQCDARILDLLDKSLITEGEGIVSSIADLVQSIETYLIDSGFIPKHSTKYWIDLRPTHSVSLG